MTVETTAPPRKLPAARASAASRATIWSPSITAPSAVTAMIRSASPSSAKPTSAPFALTASTQAAIAVDPTSALMLRPSGASPIACTVAPRAVQHVGQHRVTGAVCAVDHDRQRR